MTGGARTFLSMLLGFEPHHPGGMTENSPAFQRWDGGRIALSPVGTAEPAIFLPSLRDLSRARSTPSVETLGYSRLSLRDTGSGSIAQILLALDRNVRAPPFSPAVTDRLPPQTYRYDSSLSPALQIFSVLVVKSLKESN
jgi:hypothetical protein